MTEGTIRSKTIFRNIIHGFSAWVFPLFLSFVVTRVVVRSLGTSDYGIYTLVLGFVSYSFNFSIGRAITKFLSGDRSPADIVKIRGVISATILLTLLLAGIGSTAIVALSRWLVTDVFAVGAASHDKAITALRLAAAIISALMIGQIGTAVFQGLQRFDVYSKIQTATSIVTMLGNLVLAYYGHGLLSLMYWNLVATVIFSTLAVISAHAMLNEMGMVTMPSRESVTTALRYSVSVIGYQAIGNAFFLFERGWIISKLGADELTFYAVPMSIGLFLHGLVVSLNLVVFPLTSELAKDRDRLIRLYQTATRSVMLIVLIIVISLIVCGRLFLTLWLGTDFGERSSTILSVQSVAFGLAAIGIVAFQTAEGLGHPEFNLRNTIMGAVAALVLAILLIAPFGSLGVAFGRVAYFLVPAIAIFDLERRYLGGFRPAFWAGFLIRLAAACLAAYVIEATILTVMPPTWLTLTTAIVLAVVGYVFVLVITGYVTPEDRRLVRRLAA